MPSLTVPLTQSKGSKTGMASMPLAFNRLMERVVLDFLKNDYTNTSNKGGVEWADNSNTNYILVWADNFSIVGSSIARVQVSINSTTSSVKRTADMSWNPGSLQYVLGGSLVGFADVKLKTDILDFVRTERVKVLGTVVDETASSTAMLCHRLDKANQTFARYAHALMDPKIALKTRLCFLSVTVFAAFTYGIALIVPTTGLLLCSVWMAEKGGGSTPQRRLGVMARFLQKEATTGTSCLLGGARIFHDGARVKTVVAIEWA